MPPLLITPSANNQLILNLQTDTFGAYGGIPTYNKLVCRVLDELGLGCGNCVLIAMDNQESVAQEAPRHPNLELTGFSRNRVRFVIAALWFVLRNRTSLTLAGHLNYAPLCLLLKTLRPKMRVGVFIYGTEVWGRVPLMRRWALRRADFVISISDYTRKQAVVFNALDEKRVEVLPNAIEWRATETAKTTAPDLGRGTKLLSVGRLDDREQQKGFDTVIRSLPSIVEKVGDVQYIIIGSGSDLERHKELAQELNVSDRVHFLGTVDEPTLRHWYESCDVFAMPSAQEGFGFVYLEAMQYGKPVVAAKSGGTPEVVIDGATGRLVEYGDHDELSRVLIDLCQNPAEREKLGAAGYQRLQEKFTYASFNRKLTEILLRELPSGSLSARDESYRLPESNPSN
ncbi:MAG TPA: glycosyltransferase family 4 protein [Pyrinomonadaceae bacterium]|nr:glycosyltransferase family 4 protein [Pyrinomonadaceae bacterium]